MTIGRDPQREQLELFHAFSGELPARKSIGTVRLLLASEKNG